MLKTNTRFQKETVSEEQAQENGNTARAFVNGVWVDDNEKFACEYTIDLRLLFQLYFQYAVSQQIPSSYFKN